MRIMHYMFAEWKISHAIEYKDKQILHKNYFKSRKTKSLDKLTFSIEVWSGCPEHGLGKERTDRL